MSVISPYFTAGQLDPCLLASHENLVAIYENGNQGVGATLTNNTSLGALVIDGVTPNVGDRILVEGQTEPFENGIYDVLRVGDAFSKWVLIRSNDFRTPAQMKPGSFVTIVDGEEGKGSLCVLVMPKPVKVGRDPIIFICSSANPDVNDLAHIFEVEYSQSINDDYTAIYDNGVSGVGATLTNSGASAIFEIDGVAADVGSRVLIWFNVATLARGIYVVTDVGGSEEPWVLTRATDYDTSMEINQGDFIFVTDGDSNENTLFTQTEAAPISVGVTPIIFDYVLRGSAFLKEFLNIQDGILNARSNLEVPHIVAFGGDPNGDVAGVVGDFVLNTADDSLWQATVTGDAATTVWVQQSGGSTGGVSANLGQVDFAADDDDWNAWDSILYDNGVSGVGATLTNGGPTQGALTINGAAVTIGTTILVSTGPADGFVTNGIYEVTDVGSGATDWVITRTTNFDTSSKIKIGDYAIILNLSDGFYNRTTFFVSSQTPVTIGTDDIEFQSWLANGKNLMEIGQLNTGNTLAAFNHLASFLTTAGDLIVKTDGGGVNRLPIGIIGQHLEADPDNVFNTFKMVWSFPFGTLIGADGIDFKTTGDTALATTQGFFFFPHMVRVYIDNANTVSVAPEISIGTNSPTFDNILGATTLTDLDTTGEFINIPLTSALMSVAPSTSISVNVSTGATATTLTGSVQVIGQYIS